jgi:DNA-binding transcriptional MocR family regulator
VTTQNENLIWQIRYFIYQHFTSTTQPPTLAETADRFHLSLDETRAAYQELHQRDAIYLEPGKASIRMAFPFSAVPTPFRVHTLIKSYWANCAWDALGIPAALQCDAIIETTCAESQQPLTLFVHDSQLFDHSEWAHFLLPFRQWYDDLEFT